MPTKAPTKYGPGLMLLRAIMILLPLAMLVINAYFLYYMDRLERDGCRCSMGWKRTFIEASLIVWMVAVVVQLFMSIESTWFWIGPLVQIIILANIFVTRSFISQIKSEHCKCAETKAFKMLNIVNAVQLGLLAAALAILIINLLASMARRRA